MKEIRTSISEDYPEIYFIEGQRDGKYPYSHSILFRDTLIDTGISSGFLRKLKRKAEINNVILSHWHEDHIAGNRLLPGASFMAHQDDVPVIEDVSKMYEYYHVKDHPDQMELFQSILEGLRLEDTTINTMISDRDVIRIYDFYHLQVIHTPGHTKGHCCFYEKKSKIAFLADIDLSTLGPWYGGADSNVMEFEQSIKKVQKFDIEIAVTSHKGVIYRAKEIQKNLDEYLNKIYERDEKILNLLSETTPKDLEDLSGNNIVYPRYTEYEIYEKLAERVMIKSHLEKLSKQGKTSLKNSGYILN